jgi:hypothetical protein
VLGRPLVAKEDRLVLGEDRGRKDFELFGRSKQLARRIAGEFNEKLECLRLVDKDTPRPGDLS